MRIVTLDYALTDLTLALGKGEALVGAVFPLHPQIAGISVVAEEAPAGMTSLSLVEDLLKIKIDWEALAACQPDAIFISHPSCDALLENQIREDLSKRLQRPLIIKVFSFLNLTKTFASYEEYSKIIKVPEKGRMLAQKLKSQFLIWSDNFYERMRSKKVVIISKLNPLELSNGWFGELIRMAGGVAMEFENTKNMSFAELVTYNPHVLIVAPSGYSFAESKKTFLSLEKLTGWEQIYAVKRGDVYFTDGTEQFYSAAPNVIINSGSIVISCMAGLESGYISPKDSFVKLRTLELFRHKI